MTKKCWILLFALVFLSSCAGTGFKQSDLEGLEKTEAQQTISSGSGVYWSAEKDKINANFTELYNKVVSSVSLSGSDLIITFSDATTVSADISGIQDGDDQTATEVTFTPYSTLASTNVQAAIQELLDEAASGGASQLTDLSDVSGATATNRYVLIANGSTFVARLLTEADISDLGSYQVILSEGAFVDGDKDKLDGIESAADVTDATNVAAAGAVMDSDFSSNGIMERTGAGTYGQADSSDVVGLFNSGTCSGYLKSDGSCDTPSTGSVTISDDESTNDAHEIVFTTNNSDLETDGDITYNPSTGILTITGGVNVPAGSAGPQVSLLYEDTDNGTNYVGWGSPASNNNDLILLIPSSDPAGELLSCAAPSSVTFKDGVARDASVCSWVSNADTSNALAANGSNCSAGSYPLGVDASGAVEGCTDATTEIDSAISSERSATKTLTNTTISYAGTGNDFTMPYELPVPILTPADADDPMVDKVSRAVTLTSIDCVALGGGTISVDLQECDGNGANCASSGATIASCGATSSTDSTLTDSAIDSGDVLRIFLGAPSGTVDQVLIKINGTQVM